MKKIKILDCTLRDGGYYVDWNFNKSTVDKYLSAISEAKTDIVEIGFRFFPCNNSLGAFAYSSDEYLETLSLPSNLDIAIMINAKEFIEFDLGIEIAVNSVFTRKIDSPVGIVRIATDVNDIEKCQSIALELDKLGYRVFLNLMKIDSIETPVLTGIVSQINEWGCVEVFYFADSFGGMNQHLISHIVDAIKSVWNGGIGIHAHDNKGHALINSLSAIDAGVSYVDATILGMGRGAGNTKMENLLVEITDKNLGKYNPDAIFPLALIEFSQLQEQYKWGSSIFYYLSAVHGIHPTYVQEMLSDGRYNADQVLSAITFLKDKTSSSYSLKDMMKALSTSTGSIHGSWSAKDWAKNREVLIIGSGPSISKYHDKIEQYIEEHNPIVLCLNINQNVSKHLVDVYISCHESRIAIEMDLYEDLRKPIILPMSKISATVCDILSNVDILDYGLKIEKNSLSAQYNGCVLDKPLVLMYALSLLSVSGVKKISLTGVDGYKEGDPKQQEMVSILNQFIDSNRDLDLYTITPSTYQISQALIV